MAQVKKPRVLIAEDESHSRLLLKAVLSSMNCEVVGEATTGAEAIELFRQLKPHLLLLDINMPNKTGDEALKEIMAEHPRAFVIMLTSVADLDSIERCLELGAANYIRKDTPVAEIKQAIKETWQAFLEDARQAASSQATDAN
jgi:two-component system, chemotaxis family, chemotaxis protein CheY